MPERIIDLLYRGFYKVNRAIQTRYNELMGYGANHIPGSFGNKELKQIQARNEQAKEQYKARKENIYENENA